MPLIDHRAADTLRQLRESQGHSPESLAESIKGLAESAPWGHRGAVDAWTIRRIESEGYMPGSRVRYVLSSYFEESIWFMPPSKKKAAA